MWRENIQELQRLDHPSGWHLDIAEGFGEAFVHIPRSRAARARAAAASHVTDTVTCAVSTFSRGPSVRVVDRIEFDPRVRRIDVACDLAFLAMDLEAHGQRWAARELVSAYRRAGMSPGSEALRSFYAAHWALVRAKVALIAAAEHDGDARASELRSAERLWSLSERLCWRARAPVAIVICGPAASGKSVLAASSRAARELPVVSSDAVRKRLAHLRPDEPARPEHYSAAFTRETYEQLARDALLAFGLNDGVIVDATCRSRAGSRTAARRACERLGVPLQIVRCESPAAADPRARRATSAGSAACVRRDSADRRGAVSRLRGARRAARGQRSEARHGARPPRSGRAGRTRAGLAALGAGRRSPGRDASSRSVERRTAVEGSSRCPAPKAGLVSTLQAWTCESATPHRQVRPTHPTATKGRHPR